MLSSEQSERLLSAVQEAVHCETTSGVPAELTIAQWALESGWGARQPGNNCFGIKAYPGCYGVQSLQTFEVVKGVRTPLTENFATFPTLAACFAKHAILFTKPGPYVKAWIHFQATRDLQMLISEISPVYASDPNYANTLFRILQMHEVQAALAKVRAAATSNPPPPGNPKLNA